MYGLVQEIHKKNLIILCNNGKYYYYNVPNQSNILKAYSINDRVAFKLKGKRVVSVQKLMDKEITGKIFEIVGDMGLAYMDSGETLAFDKNSFIENYNSLSINQAVKGIAVSPSQGKFGYLTSARTFEKKHITSDTLDIVEKKLLSTFKNNTVVGFDEIMPILEELNITPNEYGFQSDTLLLQQFTNVLRVDDVKKSVVVFDGNVDNEQYLASVKIVNSFGFDHPTKFQERAFRDPNFWSNNHVLLMGMTSSGKTIIPIVKYINDINKTCNSKNMLIAVPYRALASQMHQSLKKILKDYNLDIAISTSEIISRDNDIKNGDVDIAIVIYEKLFIFNATIKNFLDRYDYITLDEAGIVQTQERGIKAEIILLSANFTPNLKVTILGTPYFQWDEYISQYSLYPIKSYHRPVPIHEFFLTPDLNQNNLLVYSLNDSSGIPINCGKIDTFKNSVANMCEKEMRANRKTIAFKFSQNASHEFAIKMYYSLKKRFHWNTPQTAELNSFKYRFLKEYHLTEEELSGVFDKPEDFDALRHGITFHHSSLPEAMRMAIEQELLDKPKVIDGGIKLIFATETLAFGLNGNVDTVIMLDMQKNDQGCYRPLSSNEYQNCIGRSGRLGYVGYGTSYAFMPYFPENGDAVHALIDNYGNTVSTDISSVDGALGKSLALEDWSEFAMFLLSMFKNQRYMTNSQFLTLLKTAPKNEFVSEDILKSKLDSALELLISENMVTICESHTFSTSDEITYEITTIGTLLQGYAISIESYHLIRTAHVDLFKEKDKHYLIDFLFSLSACNEVFLLCRNLLLRPNEKYYAEDLADFIALWDTITPDLLENGYISQDLYNSVLASPAFVHARANHILNDNLYKYLIRLKMSLISMLWILGYSLGLINDISQYNNGKLNNIKRKLGEKMSYITDISKAIASADNISLENKVFMTQLSLCLFYGIRLDWIQKQCITELTPEEARSFHLASMYSQRKKYICEHGNQSQLDELLNSYETLDGSVKKILERNEI